MRRLTRRSKDHLENGDNYAFEKITQGKLFQNVKKTALNPFYDKRINLKNIASEPWT